MAINPYQPDDQLPSADYSESLRNCPTPSLLDFNADDFIGTFEGQAQFESLQDIDIFDGLSSPDFASLTTTESCTTEGSLAGQIAAATATTSTQITAMASHHNVIQPNYVDMQPSTSFLTANSPFDGLLHQTSSFIVTEQLEPFPYEEDIKPSIADTNIDSASDTMTASKKAAHKDKCMSKNAILARQNREKKKYEQNNLVKRVKDLEEENASLKKKNKELSDNYSNVISRNTYLEAIIQNLPQIMNMVDHMQKFPGPSATKGSNSSSNPNSTNKKT